MDLLNPPTNHIGTALFLSYIATALVLSTRTILHLHRRHRLSLPRPSSPPSTSSSPAHQNRHHRRRRLAALTALATTSFASLSYHMLSFLRLSYTAFCASHRLDPFPISPSPSTTVAQLRSWMLGSTLFTDFARDLATATGADGVWVRTALLWSLGASLAVGIEGRREGRGRRLGELVVLAQVLPAGFAGTLFLIGAEIEEGRGWLEESGSKPSAEEEGAGARGGAKPGEERRNDVRVGFVVPLAVVAYLVLLPSLRWVAETSTANALVGVGSPFGKRRVSA